jgi:hypothetical protein
MLDRLAPPRRAQKFPEAACFRTTSGTVIP